MNRGSSRGRDMQPLFRSRNRRRCQPQEPRAMAAVLYGPPTLILRNAGNVLMKTASSNKLLI